VQVLGVDALPYRALGYCLMGTFHICGPLEFSLTIPRHAVIGYPSLGASESSDTIAAYPVYCVCSLLRHMLHAHKGYQTPAESSLLALYQQPSSILPYLTSFSSPPLFSTLGWAQHLAVRYPLMSHNLAVTATIGHHLLLLL
jgi:hypothetical protein